MGYFTLLDGIVVAVYFVATMGIGLYFWHKSRTPEGFTAAGRSLPGWLVGISIFATYLSSISYLALPGKAFAANWNPLVFSLAVPVATWIAVVKFLPYYRASGDISAYANLESRFGNWARLYASVFYLLTQLARIGVITYLLALPMSVLFGWNMVTIILITGITTTVYTFIGGIVAVIWTDVFQTIVLMFGAFVVLAVLCFQVDGGPIAAMSYAYDQGKLSLGSFGVSADSKGTFSFDFASATIFVVFLYGICENLKNFGIDQSYVQRYQTAKNEKEARKSLWLGGVLYLPVSLLFFLIGTLIFVLYTTGPNAGADLFEVRQVVAHQRLMQSGVVADYVTDSETGKRVFAPEYQRQVDELAVTLSDSEIGDSAFPHFIGKYLPPGLTGLLIAAIFAAGMSTISGSLNSSATLIMRDWYQRLLRPNASQKESMLVLYFGTILWGVLGTGVAILLIQLTESTLDIWWMLSGIFGGGMLGLFLLGMMSNRARNLSAILAVVFGSCFIFWLTIPDIIRWLQQYETTAAAAESMTAFAERFGGVSPYHKFMIPVFGATAIVLFGMFLSAFEWRRKSRTESRE